MSYRLALKAEFHHFRMVLGGGTETQLQMLLL